MSESTLPPTPIQSVQATQPKKRGKFVALILLVLLVGLIYFTMGVYSVQPIGAIPDGATVIVWRTSNEPFFNSADATCLRTEVGVSLLCRGMALKYAPTNRIVLRLPYQQWAYLLSTGGKSFER